MAVTVQEQIAEGLKHHHAGRLDEAEAVYRRILAADPNVPGAVHLIGVVYAQRQQYDQAIPYIRRATQLSPNEGAFHSNLAQAYLETGAPELAAVSAQRAVQLSPNDASAWHHLGNSMRMLDRTSEAIAALDTAVRLNPNFIDAWQNLALTLKEVGRYDDAAEALRRTTSLKPNDPRTDFVLAQVLHEQKRYAEAIAAYKRSIAGGFEAVQSYSNMGASYQAIGQLDDAIAATRKSLELDSNNTAPHNNLGYALSLKGELDEAITCYRRSIELRADNCEALNNLGNALLEQLKTDEAMEAYERALYFKPAHFDAHWNRSLLWLLLGEWKRAWLEYEWRWMRFPDERRRFSQVQWDGFDIAGRTILLHAEQGLGDALQFVRYVKLVLARGAKVHLECKPPLVKLFSRIEGIASVTSKGEPLPAFDAHCPFLSLPFAFGMESTDAIPREVPYLSADPDAVAAWSAKLGSTDKKRVGIVWAGSTIHSGDRLRSLGLARFTPLNELSHIQLISLQKELRGDDAKQIAAMKLLDLTGEIRDFADTAALVANLDLVITVDTSVAHLAGAMGKPVWILLPFAPDWRWMLGREDSPWYPTARLFRQPRRNDWDSVMARVIEALKGV